MPKTISELPNRPDFDDLGKVAVDDSLQSYYVTGAQIRAFIEPLIRYQSQLLKNIGLSVTASAGAMTVALKQKDGSTNPTTGRDQSEIAFRSTTLTSGALNAIPFAASLSLVIPSGATLNFLAGDDAKVFIYAYYDGTNKGLFVSSRLLDERFLWDIDAISNAADDDGLYGDASRTNAAIRLIGEFTVEAIATAGTWTAPDLVVVQQFQAPASFNKTPTRQEFTSGTGTYNTPAGARYLHVKMVGAGGGGGGQSGVAGTGTDTDFGDATAGGGTGGNPAAASDSGGGPGGTGTLGTFADGRLVNGGNGDSKGPVGTAGGGTGAPTPYGGWGAGGYSGSNGADAQGANSGSGGGGSSGTGGSAPGGGGGAGAYIELFITNPDPSYAYAVGVKGSGGTGSPAGGNGSDGFIEVTEHY